MRALNWFKTLDEKQRTAVITAIGFVTLITASAAVSLAEILVERECIQHTSGEMEP